MAKEKISTVADLPGVGEKTALKLKQAGYIDMMAIAAASPAELINIAELGEQTAEKIIEAAREVLNIGYEPATKVLERRLNIAKVTTSSKNLDALLGGGIETQAVTEVHGAFGSGKSQIGFQLAVNAQLPQKQGGLGGGVIFIDAEATFRPERVKQMAEASGLDANDVLKNINVARAYNSDHQVILAEKAGEMIKENNAKLLIVDSITSLFRSDFTGRGELASRQQKLNRHLHTLQRLADIYNIAVYITNQVMARPDVLYGDPTVAVGGHIIGHFCVPSDTLVQLDDGEIAKIEDVAIKSSLVGVDLYRDLKATRGGCSNVFLNTNADKLYEIEANTIIKATPQHGLFTLRGLDIYETPAENIKVGDFIAVPNRLEIGGEKQRLPPIEVPILVKLNKDQSKIIKAAFKKKGISIKRKVESLGINPRQLRRVLNQGYPTYRKNMEKMVSLLELPETLVDELKVVETKKHRMLQIPEELNEGVAECLGYFLGDGNFEKTSIRLREEREDVIRHYKDVFERIFGIETRLSRVKNKNCWNLSINSVHVKSMFTFLKTHYMELISKSPKGVVAAFIRGFFDAEGHVNRGGWKITVGNMDRTILEVIQMLLLRFGIMSNLRKVKIGWAIHLFSRNVRTYYEKIGLAAESKRKRMENYVKKKSFSREIVPVKKSYMRGLLSSLGRYPSHYLRWDGTYVTRKELKKVLYDLNGLKVKKKDFIKLEKLRQLFEADITWQRVKKKKIISNFEPLYDISIPRMENFVANSTLVHNSTYRVYVRKSKADTRIARLIDSPNMPEGEAVFCVKPEGIRDPE